MSDREWDREAAARVGVLLVRGWADGIQGKPRTGTDWAYVVGHEGGSRPEALREFAERAIYSCTSFADVGLSGGCSFIPPSLMREHLKKHLPHVTERMMEAFKPEERK